MVTIKFAKKRNKTADDGEEDVEKERMDSTRHSTEH
jgi:hypothetical protein